MGQGYRFSRPDSFTHFLFLVSPFLEVLPYNSIILAHSIRVDKEAVI